MIIGSRILRFAELSSTNNHAAMLIRDKSMPEGTVVSASFQTKGRGQPGNIWESEEGKNLLFSVILYPTSVLAEEQFYISMAVSLGICDFLAHRTSGYRIKWPNDIYLGDDKIAGILIENALIGETIESCVAGIGFNLNQEIFPDSVPNPVSLKIATGINYDNEGSLAELLSNLDARYRELLYGDREKLKCDYISKLYRFQEPHNYRVKGRMLKARITGISESGLLQVLKDDGQPAEYRFKEIDYVQ